MSNLDIFDELSFHEQYIHFCVYYIMGYLNPNSLIPKKSKCNLSLGDILLTSNGYMKVSCLRPLTLVSLVFGGQ
jgi:hypothetical protein